MWRYERHEKVFAVDHVERKKKTSRIIEVKWKRNDLERKRRKTKENVISDRVKFKQLLGESEQCGHRAQQVCWSEQNHFNAHAVLGTVSVNLVRTWPICAPFQSKASWFEWKIIYPLLREHELYALCILRGTDSIGRPQLEVERIDRGLDAFILGSWAWGS